MTAKEVIDELSKYAPNTEVRCLPNMDNPFCEYEDTKGIFVLKTPTETVIYISHG